MIITEIGTFSRNSTGNATVILNTVGFTAEMIRLKISGKSGDTVNHLSDGSSNGSNSEYSSNYTDSTGSQTKRGTDKVISHWERVSGTLTEKIAATMVSIDEEEFTLNFTAADSAYSIHVIAVG